MRVQAGHLTSSSVVALSSTFIYNKKPKSILIKCCIMAALILKGNIREMHKVNAFFKKIKNKIDYGDVESFIPCLKTKQSIDILGEGKIIKEGVLLSQSLIDTPVVGIFEGTKVSFTFVRKNNYIPFPKMRRILFSAELRRQVHKHSPCFVNVHAIGIKPKTINFYKSQPMCARTLDDGDSIGKRL
jgi:hypothetical protein